MSRASCRRLWSLSHPVWLCAFRPFFALTALSALGLMLPWVLFLTLGWPLPALGGSAGGALAWHAHELLLGMGLAAAAGFVLTAVPEFTRTSAFAARHVRRLAACCWPRAWPLPPAARGRLGCC